MPKATITYYIQGTVTNQKRTYEEKLNMKPLLEVFYTVDGNKLSFPGDGTIEISPFGRDDTLGPNDDGVL